jgi:hypothetical protein
LRSERNAARGGTSAQPSLDLRQRPGVQDVRWLEPPAARLVYAIVHERQGFRGVRIGVDHDRDTQLTRAPDVHIVKIEPVRLGVQLDGDAVLRGCLKHRLDIDVVRFAPVDQATRRMRENVDAGLRDRADHALRHALPVEARCGMQWSVIARYS